MNVIDLTFDSDDDQHDSQPYLSAEEDMYSDDPADEDGSPILPLQRVPAEQMAPNVNSYDIPQVAPQQLPAPGPADPFGGGDVWGDYILDDAFDDENIARAIAQMEPQVAQLDRAQPVVDLEREALAQQPAPDNETRDECVANVLALFPDICSEHVLELFDKVAHSSDRLIAHILDKMEKGSPYPKAKDKQKTRKRKREINDDEAAELKYGAPDREGFTDMLICQYIKSILQVEFPETPMHFIMTTLQQSKYRLYHAYRVLEEAHRTFDANHPPYNKIKTARKMQPNFQDAGIQAFIANINSNPSQVEVLRELCAARRIRRKAEEKRELELEAEREEAANELRAKADGTMSECGCCFGDFPLNRMVHCDADILHWFCKTCAKQNADTEIGNSRYELHCMSMDGCEGGFSMDQRSIFLDEKTTIALERNEQEAVLRMAGIENLESCPFCPYAAEYPPVEVNKEFRCEAPDCEKVSCRLCKLESHIPKSCDEFAKENGLSIRRQIEEAMSAALIRKCNKCGTPFVKEEGCNKMTCTLNGCNNVQCYVCSESCSYNHFNDPTRGGKKGNCPLFDDSVLERHDNEVKKAEEEALKKVRAEHPEYSEEELKVKMSENVLKDDEERKRKDPRALVAVMAQQQRLRAQQLLQQQVQKQAQHAQEQARIRAVQPNLAGNVSRNNMVQNPFPQGAQHNNHLGFAAMEQNPVSHNIAIPANDWLHDDEVFLGLWGDARDVINLNAQRQPPQPPPQQQPQPPAYDFQQLFNGDFDDELAWFNRPNQPGNVQVAHHAQAQANNNARPAVAAQLPARPRVGVPNRAPRLPLPGLGRVRTPSKNKAPEVPAERDSGGAQVNVLQGYLSRVRGDHERQQQRKKQFQAARENQHPINLDRQPSQGQARLVRWPEAMQKVAAPQQILRTPNALAAAADDNIHLKAPQVRHSRSQNVQQEAAGAARSNNVGGERGARFNLLAHHLERKRRLDRDLLMSRPANEANPPATNYDRDVLKFHQQKALELQRRRMAANRAAQNPFFEGKAVPRGPRADSLEPADGNFLGWRDFAGRG